MRYTLTKGNEVYTHKGEMLYSQREMRYTLTKGNEVYTHKGK